MRCGRGLACDPADSSELISVGGTDDHMWANGERADLREAGSSSLRTAEGTQERTRVRKWANLSLQHTHPCRHLFLTCSSQGQPSSLPEGCGCQPDTRWEGDGVASAFVCHSVPTSTSSWLPVLTVGVCVCVCVCVCVHAHVLTQSCPALCDPMDCSPPGSSDHGIF